MVEAQEAPRAAATARVEPERPPGPVASWQGTARAAATPAPAAWLLLVFLAFLLLPALLLYSRLRRQDVLANATRAALCELVRARPGLAAGGLARALARNRTSVLHHLRVLRGAGLVEARVVGRRTRYFPAGSGDDDAQRRVRVALASPVARRVALHLALRGADSLGAIARATGVPKSTVRWHVNRLARLGAFSDEGVFDRERVLRALPPAPAPEAATEAGVSPS
ncbi:MAG TPA: helix-turn-helix domain-containing protein [Candidatus Thermoplasmatota archaeon]|nr:helix-turn-helix domain-containing protein [Candidatus Thermoplasmatota archaeon]